MNRGIVVTPDNIICRQTRGPGQPGQLSARRYFGMQLCKLRANLRNAFMHVPAAVNYLTFSEFQYGRHRFHRSEGIKDREVLAVHGTRI